MQEAYEMGKKWCKTFALGKHFPSYITTFQDGVTMLSI